jgi:hypothetical protein
MPLSNSQIRWREIATTAVVEVFILLAFGFAVVRYVEWSSDAAVAEFMGAGQSRVSTSSGRTSAPRRPQAWPVNRGSISESRTSSGHLSAVIAVQWLQ